jgi:hypothetical protein
LAASAAPAAICCFFDFAGIQNNFAPNEHFGSMRQSQEPTMSEPFSEVIRGI